MSKWIARGLMASGVFSVSGAAAYAWYALAHFGPDVLAGAYIICAVLAVMGLVLLAQGQILLLLAGGRR